MFQAFWYKNNGHFTPAEPLFDGCILDVTASNGIAMVPCDVSRDVPYTKTYSMRNSPSRMSTDTEGSVSVVHDATGLAIRLTVSRTKAGTSVVSNVLPKNAHNTASVEVQPMSRFAKIANRATFSMTASVAE